MLLDRKKRIKNGGLIGKDFRKENWKKEIEVVDHTTFVVTSSAYELCLAVPFHACAMPEEHNHLIDSFFASSCHLCCGSKPNSFLALSIDKSVSFCPFVGVYLTPWKQAFTSSSLDVRMHVSAEAMRY